MCVCLTVGGGIEQDCEMRPHPALLPADGDVQFVGSSTDQGGILAQRRRMDTFALKVLAGATPFLLPSIICYCSDTAHKPISWSLKSPREGVG